MAWMGPAFPTRGTSITLPTTQRKKDQDIFLSASIDNQTTAAFINMVRYGLTRKREQYNLWAAWGSG